MVRPRVTLSHRSHSRSILNEEDILTLINGQSLTHDLAHPAVPESPFISISFSLHALAVFNWLALRTYMCRRDSSRP